MDDIMIDSAKKKKNELRNWIQILANVVCIHLIP